MEYVLYNKIREQLIKDYIFLKGIDQDVFLKGIDQDVFLKGIDQEVFLKGIDQEVFLKGGGVPVEFDPSGYPQILPNMSQYKPLSSLDNIKKQLESIRDFSGYKELLDNLKKYIDVLDYLIPKTDSYLLQAQDIPKKLDPENKLKELYENKNFKKIIDEYNDKIKKTSWTKERINNEFSLSNLDRDDIFMEVNTFENFNNQLLMLFSPYLNNYDELKNKTDLDEKRSGLLQNIDNEIENVNDLIKLAQEFNNYVNEKKKNINKILNFSYSQDDIIFIDNSDKKIKETEFLIKLEEKSVPEESQLNLAEIRNIQNTLIDAINGLKLKDQMENLKNFNILNVTDNLNDILNIDKAISIKKSQSGGEFETKYITTSETNKKMFSLLKKVEKLYEIIETTLDDAKYLKEVQYRYNFYLAYLFLVIRQTSSKDEMYVYKYLTKDKINKYINVLTKIKNKFTNLQDSDKNTIYLNKYHYLTIEKISNVLQFILSKFPSDNHVVDVDKCKGNILNDLNLFNHFKSIIIAYVSTSEGKTITGLTDPSDLEISTL